MSRSRQLERTRNAIVEAATSLVFDSENPSGFTMQAVADRAGVSHRTLYRHFPTRQALINAVGARFDASLAERGEADRLPESFEEWVGSIDRILAVGATHANLLRRAVDIGVTTGQWRTDRDDRYWRLFRERFPHLPEEEAREDFAILRHVLWSASAFLVGERFDLAPRRVAAGIRRSVEALVASIAARDAAAATGAGP